MRFLNLLYIAVTVLPFVNAYNGEKIPDSYIVVFNDDVSEVAVASSIAWASETHAAIEKRHLETRGPRGNGRPRAGVKNKYKFGKFKGYHGEFDKATIAEIAARPEVAYVEQDAKVELNAIVSQAPASSWGLARISNKARTGTNYYYDSTAGSGVTAYIIDTGVLASHTDFGGRATQGWTYFSSEANSDLNGHGTHVSATVAGTVYGVAKKAKIIGVKVLNSAGSGSNAGVIAGINWAVSDAKSKGITTKAVANMSLGGSYSSAVNNAVAAAVTAGISFAVAAGNDGANASNYSPASTPSAITVGSTTNTDARSSFSNYGSVVDVFAPGSNIKSAWIGSNSATNTISGTSMASPHVAGLAAYLIGLEGLSTPSAVTSRIIALAQTGLITSPGSGSPNRLVYNGSGY